MTTEVERNFHLSYSEDSVFWECSGLCLSNKCPFCLDNDVEASVTTALSNIGSPHGYD